MTIPLLFSALAALASAQSVPRAGVVPSVWRAPVQSVLAGINPASFAAARIGGAEISPTLSALKNLDLETPAGLRAAEPLIARLSRADTLSGFAALPEARREALLVNAAADVAAESRRESEALLRDAQYGDLDSLRPRLIALASRAPYLGPGGFETLAEAVALKEAERRSVRAAGNAQGSVEALERERREQRESFGAARSEKPEPQKLGVLENPGGTLGGGELPLNGWQYGSFRTMEGPESRLGEPLIEGKPASESPLQFKHVVRSSGREGEFSHEFSFLAAGATPAGVYRVEFPGAGASPESFAFTVRVAQKEETETPQRRLSSAFAALAKPEPHEPSLTFAHEVPDVVKKWLPSHQAIIDRQLSKYERYLREDPLLPEDRRAARFAEVERIDRLFADIAAGRVHRRGLDALIAQVMAAERPVLENFKDYFRADPAQSRVYVELALQQMQLHHDLLVDSAEVWGAVAAAQGDASAGFVSGAASRLAGAWFKARYAWIFARQALRLRFASWLPARRAPSAERAAAPASELRFTGEVGPEQRRFLTGVRRALDEIAGPFRAYVAADASLDDAARAAKLAPLERSEEFVRQRAAAEGFRWTNPAMATNLLNGGVYQFVADYSDYAAAEDAPIDSSARLSEAAQKLLNLLEDARNSGRPPAAP
jgi:hypothetical protein